MATVTRERELLRELVALVRGECPSLLNEDSGGDVRLSMAIDDALASPPAEDAGWARWLGPDETPLQRMEREFRDCQAVTGLLAEARAEIERLKAQAPPPDPPGLPPRPPLNVPACDLPRYGVTWQGGKTEPLLTPMADGYWTPWHLASQALAARQSDPPGLVANWRPIETAPKRTDVLAGWADRPHWLPQVLQQDDAGMWFSGEESDYRPPTHWMPLPASPQAETKGDE